MVDAFVWQTQFRPYTTAIMADWVCLYQTTNKLLAILTAGWPLTFLKQ